MQDIIEELGNIFEEFDVHDEFVLINHEVVDKLNKKYHHNIKKPIDFGNKAS